MSTPAVQQILVVCTGNSCRSVMAEALINQLGEGRLQAKSAGSQPTGYVHPQALETLRRHDIDPGAPSSESWDNYAGYPFDLVITVCDSAASEVCPVFSGPCRKLHWSTPDPAKTEGTDMQISQAFDRAFNQLKQRIEQELL